MAGRCPNFCQAHSNSIKGLCQLLAIALPAKAGARRPWTFLRGSLKLRRLTKFFIIAAEQLPTPAGTPVLALGWAGIG